MATYLRRLFAAVLALSLGLAGCGKNPDDKNAPASVRVAFDGTKTPEELLAEWGASPRCSAQGNVVDPDSATQAELGGFIPAAACRIGPHDENGTRSGDPFSGPDYNPNPVPTCTVSQASLAHHAGETIAFHIYLSTLDHPILLVPTSPETGGAVGEFSMGVVGDDAMIFLRLTSPLPTTQAFSITAGVSAVGLAQPVTCSVRVLAEEPPVSPTPEESPSPEVSPSPIPPTATFTHVPTATFTSMPTSTFTAAPTATFTALPTATFTQLPTATFTQLPTATYTLAPTFTFTSLPTPTFTSAPTRTFTREPTATFTTAPTRTFTTSPTATFTQGPTARPTEPPCHPTMAPTRTPTPRPTMRATQAPCHPSTAPTPRPTHPPCYYGRPCGDRRHRH